MSSSEKMSTEEIKEALIEQIRHELGKQSVFQNTSIVFSGAEMTLSADIVLYGRVSKEVLHTEGTIAAGIAEGEREEPITIAVETEKRRPGRPRKVEDASELDILSSSGAVLGRA